jgi:hypothetical protein
MSAQEALDKFGQFLMENLRDRAIEYQELLLDFVIAPKDRE